MRALWRRAAATNLGTSAIDPVVLKTPVGYDELGAFRGKLRKNAFEIIHVIVFVADELGESPFRHQVSCNDAGMIVLVRYNIIAFLHKRGDDSLGSLVSCAEEEAGFLPKERREALFKHDMQIQRPPSGSGNPNNRCRISTPPSLLLP